MINCHLCKQTFKEEDAVHYGIWKDLCAVCPACVYLREDKVLICNGCGLKGVENKWASPFVIVKQKPYAILRQCSECSSVDIGEWHEDDESALTDDDFDIDLLW